MCTLHDECWAGFSYNNTLHPNGTNICQLLLCSPLRWAYDKIVSAIFDFRNMLMFISTCGIKLSHNNQGNEDGKLLRTPTNMSLKLWIALSPRFRQCMCGVTFSYPIPLFLIIFLYLDEALLSKMSFLGKMPFFVQLVNEPLICAHNFSLHFVLCGINHYWFSVYFAHDHDILSDSEHRWELPGNYPVFTVVMVIYHYVERIWIILVTPFLI